MRLTSDTLVRTAGEPLETKEFAERMARFAPFERRPVFAVAVSGGADSLALLLLASQWASAVGGAAVALTVDHGLRPRSSAEAAQVGGWLAARGVAHKILKWEGQKPPSGVMAAARAARYRLLLDWCAANGVLHLLLAHQADDQSETFLLRLSRASGPEGLAAMAGVSERAEARILRPLLDVPHARLTATLDACGQPWLEDPSNRDPRFARAHLRTILPELARRGLDGVRFQSLVGRFAARRRATEWRLADFLARAAAIHPEGWAVLDRGVLQTAPFETAQAALARLVLAVGGREYPPRAERVARLVVALRGDRPATRTLGGCLFVLRSGQILIVREPAAIAPPLAVNPGATVMWDDRFVVNLDRSRIHGVRIEELGALRFAALARRLERSGKGRARRVVPAICGAVLPALIDLDGGYSVPHLLYGREGLGADSVIGCRALFRPRRALAGPGFAGHG